MLFQPAELLIIGGASFFAFVISVPKSILILSIKDLLGVFKGGEATKRSYLDILLLFFEILTMTRREGFLAIESHINQPQKSAIFKKYPSVLGNQMVLNFICDNIKVITAAGVDVHEFDNLIEAELETTSHSSLTPSQSLNKVSDGLPGLGIVAAVLGVVITMGKMKEPPEVLGHSVGAALVGTFLGVLLCYGFVGPMSTNMEHRAQDTLSQLNMVKVLLRGLILGTAPSLAVEMGRRAIPHHERPTYEELEAAIRSGRKAAKGEG